MNRTISNVIFFVTGAVAGSLATWKFVETKYKKIAQEEIDSVKEAFAAANGKSEDDKDCQKEDEATGNTNEDPDPRKMREEYTTFVNSLGYSEQEGGTTMVGAIRVIPPHELGEADGYEVETLNYFADGVLTDDWDHPIEDIAGYVGEDYYTHFGEYEEDAVHIRNDFLKKDFEILKDLRNFADVPKHHYLVAEENDA